jgi:hypothetical protein
MKRVLPVFVSSFPAFHKWRDFMSPLAGEILGEAHCWQKPENGVKLK